MSGSVTRLDDLRRRRIHPSDALAGLCRDHQLRQARTPSPHGWEVKVWGTRVSALGSGDGEHTAIERAIQQVRDQV